MLVHLPWRCIKAQVYINMRELNVLHRNLKTTKLQTNYNIKPLGFGQP
jgi:hypothetical protein